MNISRRLRFLGCAMGAVLLSVSASGQYRQPVPPGFARLDADEIGIGAIFGDRISPACP